MDTAFDISPDPVGTRIHDVTIRSMDELEQYGENQPNVAVLTVPQHVAQPMASRLIDLGIKGLLELHNVELSTDVPDVFFEGCSLCGLPCLPQLSHHPSLTHLSPAAAYYEMRPATRSQIS